MPEHALVTILKTNPDGVPEGFAYEYISYLKDFKSI